MKYRAGHGETEFSALSNVYCAAKQNLIVGDDGSLKLTATRAPSPIRRETQRSRCFRRVVQAEPGSGSASRARSLPRGGLMRKPRS